MTDLLIKAVHNCARCGLDHINLTAKKLDRPMAPPELGIVWSHWMPCPTNGQPIMIATEPAAVPVVHVTLDEPEPA